MRDPRAWSRQSFGNSGLRSRSPTRYLSTRIFGTHGAMGGVPWEDEDLDSAIYELGEGAYSQVTYRRDQQAAIEAWRWVRSHFPKLGITLRADWLAVR